MESTISQDIGPDPWGNPVDLQICGKIPYTQNLLDLDFRKKIL